MDKMILRRDSIRRRNGDPTAGRRFAFAPEAAKIRRTIELAIACVLTTPYKAAVLHT